MDIDRDDQDASPLREQGEIRVYDDVEQNDIGKSSKNRSKDKKTVRGEEKEGRSKNRERSKKSSDDVSKERERETKDSERGRVSSRERRKDEKDEHERDRIRDSRMRDKDYDREKFREKDNDRDKERKDRGKDKDREREREVEKDIDRGRDREKDKEKSRDRVKEREKERDRTKEKEREREREKQKDREERENNKDTKREKEKEKIREKEREADQSKERSGDRERVGNKNYDGYNELSKEDGRNDKLQRDYLDTRNSDDSKQPVHLAESEENPEALSIELEERIRNMKEDRLKKKNEDVSEVLTWVSRSRKLEERRKAGKEKVMQLSKIFEEQDNIDEGESDEEESAQNASHNLAGLKILHGIDKVMEGGAVVLTLKDQNILADGGINEDVDMLENVEIGEQKRRDEAYKAAKKKTGTYDDKFNDDPGAERKILPQYDEPAADEGITLDETGRFNREAEKKLEELRRRIQGASVTTHFEDLNSSGKVSNDYYTQQEMVQFKRPKKKKSLRKKEKKLDIDALEAEAISAGLGVGDLGSRKDSRRQTIREEQERSEAERRQNAYQSAYAKADEASKSLRMEQTVTFKSEEYENPVIADDDDDLYKSLERARKLALKRQEENGAAGPEAIAVLATATASSHAADETTGESHDNKVVFTEMEEFVWGLQLDEEAQKPEEEDVFMEEDEVPKDSDEDRKDEAGGWSEVRETAAEEEPSADVNEEIVPDETIHEAAVGKGLSGALKLLKERGTLKETIDWGGRNMDKKKSKLVGILDDDEPKDPKSKDARSSASVEFKKEIHIERTDEFGRILTPKEAFRQLSHKFHGKGPGKMKQEKRMKQYQEELKLKQMKNSDTPSLSVERMREAQAQLKTPYLVLSGHVKSGQTGDPRSGFAAVEKDLPGGLTPMLGDRKVEHFLGIKRKAEPADSGASKKTKA